MSPTRPPTMQERFGNGRKDYDAAYNKARAHRPEEKALHTRRWQAVRLLAMQRDGYLCQPCLREGAITKATDAHHLKPRRTHPELTYDLANIESVCRPCHAAIERGHR